MFLFFQEADQSHWIKSKNHIIHLGDKFLVMLWVSSQDKSVICWWKCSGERGSWYYESLRVQSAAGSLALYYKWDKFIGIVQKKRPKNQLSAVSFFKRKLNSCVMIAPPEIFLHPHPLLWERKSMRGRRGNEDSYGILQSCHVMCSSVHPFISICLSAPWISAVAHFKAVAFLIYRAPKSLDIVFQRKKGEPAVTICLSGILLSRIIAPYCPAFKDDKKISDITIIIMQVHFQTLSILRAIWCCLQLHKPMSNQLITSLL